MNICWAALFKDLTQALTRSITLSVDQSINQPFLSQHADN